jgi:cobalt-zinc-cadmium efflux system membrane fusion protein
MTMHRLQAAWRIGAVVIPLAGLLGLAGCGKSSPASAAGSGSPSGNAELFTIPPEQTSHVQVVTVAPKSLQRTMRLSGAVAYNSFKTTPVITQVSGPVSRIVVAPGQVVAAGQPLLYVASPDYSQLRSNYLKAKDSSFLAQKEYARAQDLYAHHAIAEKDLLAAESAQVQANADLTATESALKVMGVRNPDDILKQPLAFEVPVLSPIAGEIVEQLVSVGQLVQPGSTQCFTVSDTNTVWVLVNIYQKDLPYVHMGDAVAIQTDTYPELFHGRISYIAAALDPNTRTLQARIVTSNPGRKLKKDMFVSAIVNAGKIPNAISVPDAAVLRDSENQPFVYAEFSSNQFGRRPVTLGESSGGQTQILNGLRPGDRVIGDGSLFLQFANSQQR